MRGWGGGRGKCGGERQRQRVFSQRRQEVEVCERPYLVPFQDQLGQDDWDGGAGHGVRGGHGVLGQVVGLQTHDRGRGGSGPAQVVLGGLPQVHHQPPHRPCLADQGRVHRPQQVGHDCEKGACHGQCHNGPGH